jgi:hypothetical protein
VKLEPLKTVSLIRLPIVAPPGSVNNEPTPPIGLAYLAGFLKKAGLNVKGIDATGSLINHVERVFQVQDYKLMVYQ